MSATWLVLLVSAGILIAALALAAAWLLVRRDPEHAALAKRIGRLSWRSKGRLAVGLARDRRIPLAVRAIPVGLVLYLAMPFDLVPDFIPVLGQLDDLLIVGLGIGLLLRFTPRPALLEHLERLEVAET